MAHVKLIDYPGLSLSGGDNSAIINQAFFDAYEGGLGGSITLPQGTATSTGNIHWLPKVDLFGAGKRKSILNLQGSSVIISGAPSSRLAASPLFGGSEWTFFGTTKHPDASILSTSPRNLDDIKVEGLTIKRHTDVGPMPAILIYGWVNSGVEYIPSNWSFEDFAISNNTSLSSTAYGNSGIEIFGGRNITFISTTIKGCYGNGIKVKAADDFGGSFIPSSNISFIGSSIKDNWKAGELFDVEGFYISAGSIENNGKGLSIDGNTTSYSMEGVRLFNNRSNVVGRNAAALASVPGETSANYHIRIGDNYTSSFIYNTAKVPNTVRISSNTFGSSAALPTGHIVMVGNVGIQDPAIYNDGFPGSGGLVLSSNSFTGHVFHPIYLTGITASAVKGYYTNNSCVPDSTSLLTKFEISNINNTFFNELLQFGPGTTPTPPDTNNYIIPTYLIPMDREELTVSEATTRFGPGLAQWEVFRQEVEVFMEHAFALEYADTPQTDLMKEGGTLFPPGGSLIMIANGIKLIDSAFSYANITDGSPFKRNTMSSMRSVSKDISGVAFALGMQLGILDAKKSVGDYVLDYDTRLVFTGFDLTWFKYVSIEELLTHRVHLSAVDYERTYNEVRVEHPTRAAFYNYLTDKMVNYSGEIPHYDRGEPAKTTPHILSAEVYDGYINGDHILLRSYDKYLNPDTSGLSTAPFQKKVYHTHYNDFSFFLACEVFEAALQYYFDNNNGTGGVTITAEELTYEGFCHSRLFEPLGITEWEVNQGPYGSPKTDKKPESLAPFSMGSYFSKPRNLQVAGPTTVYTKEATSVVNGGNYESAGKKVYFGNYPLTSPDIGIATGNWHVTSSFFLKWDGNGGTYPGFKSLLDPEHYRWTTALNHLNKVYNMSTGKSNVSHASDKVNTAYWGMGTGVDHMTTIHGDIPIKVDVGAFKGYGCYKISHLESDTHLVTLFNVNVLNAINPGGNEAIGNVMDVLFRKLVNEWVPGSSVPIKKLPDVAISYDNKAYNYLNSNTVTWPNPSALTFSAYIQPRVHDKGRQFVFCGALIGLPTRTFAVIIDTDTMELVVETNVEIFRVPLSIYEWKQVVVSINGTAARLMIDGINTSATIGLIQFALTDTWRIGANYDNTGKLEGGVGRVYFDAGVYHDLSTSIERDKFYHPTQGYKDWSVTLPNTVAPTFFFNHNNQYLEAGVAHAGYDTGIWQLNGSIGITLPVLYDYI